MEENITSDNNECTEVKLTRAQKYGSAPVEGSTFMPSRDEEDREIMNILRKLTPEYLVYALALAKGAKSSDSQGISASLLATSGKRFPQSAQ